MPAISVDTFFGCSLMIVLVLAAMTSTSHLLSPLLGEGTGTEFPRRQSLSRHFLLNDGKPPDWGTDHETPLESFGLDRTDSSDPYNLDVDKVTRLNSDNIFGINEAQIFSSIGIRDLSFRLGIKPIFEVTLNQGSANRGSTDTMYEFHVATDKQGIPIHSRLRSYVIAGEYFRSYSSVAPQGTTIINFTIPNNTEGPALMIVLAQSVSNTRIMSYNTCQFSHNGSEPRIRGTFLKLSPLDYAVDTRWVYPDVELSSAYALTYDYSSIITQTASGNQSVSYSIPHYLDPGPTVVVATGWNSTSFFAEWTSYPQIPLEAGADFSSNTRTNVFAYDYIVKIGSALYQARIWIGGPAE